MTAGEAPASGSALGDLDEFRLVRALGHGGMGTVFLGHDTVLDRLVAIKLIRARAADEISRLRFLTEARAIARLSHPNVVTIFRTATTRDGQPYIAQEWISGHSLDQLPLPFEPRRAAEIGLGIARGLAAAHRRGILHRDVKPANVMVDEAGTPKLLDFGLAKLTWFERSAHDPGLRTGAALGSQPAARVITGSPLPGLATTLDAPAARPVAAPTSPAAASPSATQTGPLTPASAAAARAATSPGPAAPLGSPPVPHTPLDHTATGAMLGTPRYLAPEVWLHQPATARSDLFSFGALLYELIAGAPPYPHLSREALEEAVVSGAPPRPLAEQAPAVHADLAALVADCLARDPAARPESADEVAHRLERILSGAPALPDGNPYPGLAPFDAGRRAVFYGRGADISAVVDRLRADSLAVVAGDSGIGKSSLCRAGVIPAVLAGALDDARTWRLRAATLGPDPVGTLRELLGLADLPADPTEAELRGALGLDAGSGLLLFLDQFEEISTLASSASASEAAALLAILAGDVPGVKLLIAVRGDFLTRVASLPELGPLVTRSLHLLRVLGPADARHAVVDPARAKGVHFESDAMIDQLTRAIDSDPGALPLVQFALAELWQRRDTERGVLRQADLDQIGGVTGALARHADSVVAALGPAERAAARRMLLALVTAEGTRASRERTELAAPDDRVGTAALEALVRGRLVIARDTAAGEPLYTLAHESLLDAWRTLRGWLDDIAGQRGLRTRLGAAADEWSRLAHRPDLLWGRAQLAETTGLDELTERDRLFLDASRRAVRRRRAVRVLLIAAVPIAVIATGLGLRARDQANRDEIVGHHLSAASGQVRSAKQSRTMALTRREQAMLLFDRNETAEGETTWRDTVSDFLGARGAFRRAADELEAALLVDARRADVREQMARVIYDQALLAEEQGDRATTDELIRRLETYDDGTLLAAWRQPATLSIDAPGAARIEVRPYVDRAGRLELGDPVASGGGQALEATLPAGSYQVDLHGRDGLVVNAPVLLARGESLPLRISLPHASQIPDGFVYIPPGRFLTGSLGDDTFRRDFLYAAPIHATTTGPYLIARHEVTFADWMTYLRALSPTERQQRRPRASSAYRTVPLGLEGDGPFELVLERDNQIDRFREGEPIRYPKRNAHRVVRWEHMPVSGVTFDDALAYAGWMAATGRIPGARLCTEPEWERAARGADGRNHPAGSPIAPDDANIDATYGRLPGNFGADEVGSHPRSDSPFGIADMLGNVWEWVLGPDEVTVKVRGGSCYQGTSSGLSTNREFGERTMRAPWSGLRLCADAPRIP